MTSQINQAVVIGAGSMGAGIATLLANAGIPVTLLDRHSGDPEDPNRLAESGLERQIQRGAFYRPEFSSRIQTGNIVDDTAALTRADWIIEAVFEDLTVKHDTFRLIEEHRSPGSLVSSNTSTIPLAQLTEVMGTPMRLDFAIVHFFNPPTTMRLVELVTGPDTTPKTATDLTRIIEQQLGKVVLHCRDTPGFIANRIGNLWMAAGARHALDNNIPIELADALFGRPFGVPRTGIFGLFDYIGLQLVPGIWGGLTTALPADDAYHRFTITDHPLFTGLLERGWTGRTGPSGFYRGRDEVVTPGFDYRNAISFPDPALEQRTAAGVITTDSPGGRFARDTFLTLLTYCCDTAAEIAGTVEEIDLAMQLGYGWKKGPFALADDIGLDTLRELLETQGTDRVPALLTTAIDRGGFYPAAGTTLTTDGEPVATRTREGVLTAAQLKEQGTVIFSTEGGTVTLLEDGVALLDLATPLNSCTREALELIAMTGREGAARGIRALVIGNDEARAFCAGADLSTLAKAAADGDAHTAADLFRIGRESFETLLHAEFPVVAAVRGVALGGGAELLLHCDAAVLHADSRIGFPERTVGLIPAWGGTARTIDRLTKAGKPNPVNQAFQLFMDAQPFPSAFEARHFGLLQHDDPIIMSTDHVLAEAVRMARDLMDDYQPAPEARITLAAPGTLTTPAGDFTDNDLIIAEALKNLLTSSERETLTAEELGSREATTAGEVIILPSNVARTAHMAKARKPLRN